MTTMTSEQISEAFRSAMTAISDLGRILETAAAAFKDKDAELQIVHETNNRLSEENARLRQRGYDLSDELAAARQAERAATSASNDANNVASTLRSQLDEALSECKRLREMILNVAVAIEKSGLGEVAKVDPTLSPSQGTSGNSPTPVGSGSVSSIEPQVPVPVYSQDDGHYGHDRH